MNDLSVTTPTHPADVFGVLLSRYEALEHIIDDQSSTDDIVALLTVINESFRKKLDEVST
ncbi:MAG: hypothetical protein NT159_23760 [Proteobacteria bacterium]|nr:hypothetical protein [Pseudomonadota bacterium]